MTTYLTVAEAATATKLAEPTIYRALASGALHGSQRAKGGKWLIRFECLDAWLGAQPCPHSTVVPMRRRSA